MILVPSDTLDFAYTVPFFKVAVAGYVHVTLADGTELTLAVRSGGYVDRPVRRLHRTGTTARGFQTDVRPAASNPDRLLRVPYVASDVPADALLTDGGEPMLTDAGEYLTA